MRQSESNKLVGIVLDTKRKVDELQNNPISHHQQEDGINQGTCIIQSSLAVFPGSICDVLILGSNGESTGHLYSNAKCNTGVLNIGDKCNYIRHNDGIIELIAGGGGTPGTTNNNITQHVINITGALWPMGTTTP